jgi:conjugative transfer region protein TrbK
MKAWLQSMGESRGQHHEAVRLFVRFATIAFVVAIMIIAIGEASRTDDVSRDVAPATMKKDPLAADLARCRDVTVEQITSNETCHRVWAENRRRFFTPHKPAEAR